MVKHKFVTIQKYLNS